MLFKGILLSFSLVLCLGCDGTRQREHPFLKMEKSASEGDPLAQESVGLALLNGTGVSQSFSQAKKWFGVCAEAGNSRCMYELAQLHEKGLGTPISVSQAGILYQAAAQAGSGLAMIRLGRMYRMGDGVPKDLIRGYAWMAYAVEKGEKEALGYLKELEETLGESTLDRGRKLTKRWLRMGPEF